MPYISFGFYIEYCIYCQQKILHEYVSYLDKFLLSIASISFLTLIPRSSSLIF